MVRRLGKGGGGALGPEFGGGWGNDPLAWARGNMLLAGFWWGAPTGQSPGGGGAVRFHTDGAPFHRAEFAKNAGQKKKTGKKRVTDGGEKRAVGRGGGNMGAF